LGYHTAPMDIRNPTFRGNVLSSCSSAEVSKANAHCSETFRLLRVNRDLPGNVGKRMTLDAASYPRRPVSFTFLSFLLPLRILRELHFPYVTLVLNNSKWGGGGVHASVTERLDYLHRVYCRSNYTRRTKSLSKCLKCVFFSSETGFVLSWFVMRNIRVELGYNVPKGTEYFVWL
jgi:hypothetical protein